MLRIRTMPSGASSAFLRIQRVVGVVPLQLWLAAVLLLAFLIRIVALGSSDLWLDEAISYFIAAKPLREIVLYTASQTFEHPPGYYLLLHLWMSLAGTSEFAMRFLSTFGGLLTVALSAALTRRWFADRSSPSWATRLALLVALMTAIQPTAAYVGREVRMYAWTMALALLSVLALDLAFRRNRWRDWGFFLVTIGLSVLFHYLAGLFVIAYGLFAVLFWRKLPAGKTRLAALLAILFGLAGAWVLTQPGPRDTLSSVVAEPQSVSRFVTSLLSVSMHWVLGNSAFYIAPRPATLLALLAWLPVAIGVIVLARPCSAARPANGGLADGDLRRTPGVLHWLIVVLLVAPPVLRALVFSMPNVRHSAMLTGILVLCTALGVTATLRRSRLLGVLLLLALLGLDGTLLARDLRDLERSFSVPLVYIQERAHDGEPIIYTHPLDQYQNAYYNQRNLQARYIPTALRPVTIEDANAAVAGLMAHTSSAWLILYPSLLEPERVEQALNELAYPAEKVWFPGGRGVVRYASDRSASGQKLGLTEQAGGLAWDNHVRLNRWAASSESLAAGDALRLRFEWQRTAPVTAESLVVLTLVGPDGSIWAKRVAAPCNGLCPAADWPAEPVIERQAFYVPADVPPGDYLIRLAWVTADGAPIMGRAEGALAQSLSTAAQIDLPLLAVQVKDPPQAGAVSPPLAGDFHAPAGPGLTLLGADFASPSLRAGQTLAVPTQWAVTAGQPALGLRLDLAGAKGQTQIIQPLGAAWYPVQMWTPGRTVRAQARFTIPGDLAPGAYRATLAVVDPTTNQVRGQARLGIVRVVDRPRAFVLPELGASLDVAWQDGIRLARVQMPERAAPGEALQMTLVWQADGPAARNWKVFIHLVDEAGVVRAQGDAYPLQGQALTPTWQKGEVLVDAYAINLPPDLPAGSYAIRLGFYDEQTGERLPLADGGDNLILPGRVMVSAVLGRLENGDVTP